MLMWFVLNIIKIYYVLVYDGLCVFIIILLNNVKDSLGACKVIFWTWDFTCILDDVSKCVMCH